MKIRFFLISLMSLVIFTNHHTRTADISTTTIDQKTILETIKKDVSAGKTAKELTPLWDQATKPTRITLFAWAALINNPTYMQTFLNLTDDVTEAYTELKGSLTPLFYAVSNAFPRGDKASNKENAFQIITMLRQVGANAKKVSPALGKSPLDMAKDPKVIPDPIIASEIETLLTKGIKPTYIADQIALACQKNEDVTDLWKKTTKSDRIWLFHWAALKNKPTCMSQLLDLTKNPDMPGTIAEANSLNSVGAAPIHYAISNIIKRGDTESDETNAFAIIKLLKEANVDLEIKSPALGGKTPIGLAEGLMTKDEQKAILEITRTLLTPSSTPSAPESRSKSSLPSPIPFAQDPTETTRTVIHRVSAFKSPKVENGDLNKPKEKTEQKDL